MSELLLTVMISEGKGREVLSLLPDTLVNVKSFTLVEMCFGHFTVQSMSRNHT